MKNGVVGTWVVHQPTERRLLGLVCTYVGTSWLGTMGWGVHMHNMGWEPVPMEMEFNHSHSNSVQNTPGDQWLGVVWVCGKCPGCDNTHIQVSTVWYTSWEGMWKLLWNLAVSTPLCLSALLPLVVQHACLVTTAGAPPWEPGIECMVEVAKKRNGAPSVDSKTWIPMLPIQCSPGTKLR